MATQPEAVSLVPFCKAIHADRLGGWLKAPHVSRWWGKTSLDVALDTSSEGDFRVVQVGSSPVGFIRWQRVSIPYFCLGAQVANERAVRCFQKAGFAIVREFTESDRYFFLRKYHDKAEPAARADAREWDVIRMGLLRSTSSAIQQGPLSARPRAAHL